MKKRFHKGHHPPLQGKHGKGGKLPEKRKGKAKRDWREVLAELRDEIEEVERREGRLPPKEGHRGKIQKKAPGPFEQINILSREALAELRKVLSSAEKQMRKAKLSQEEAEIVRKITSGKNRPHYELVCIADILRPLIMDKPEEYKRYCRTYYRGVLFSGIELIRQNRLLSANEILRDIVEDYFGNRDPVPPAVGRAAINLTRKISRAHVLAHASEFLCKLPEDYKRIYGNFPYFEIKKEERYRGSGGIVWSATAVKNLGLVGELRDILPMRIIGNACGEVAMEGYVSHAIEHILVRDALMRLVRTGKEKFERFNIKTRGMDDRILAERLYPLITELGLGHVMRLTGGPRGVRALSRSPVDLTSGQAKLGLIKAMGIEKYLSMQDFHLTEYPFGPEERLLTYASRDFLLNSGIIKEGKRGWYKLTKKGQEFIKFLITTGLNPAGELGKPTPRLQR